MAEYPKRRRPHGHVGRFSLLSRHLESIRSERGDRIFDVTVRDREPDESGHDPVLAAVDQMKFDQVWLMAADSGNGLTEVECEALTRFRKKGGGIVTGRDHQDLGSSICSVLDIGRANFFNSVNPEPDKKRRVRDDMESMNIDFPNYHSGKNGDFQAIIAHEPIHPLLKRPDGIAIAYFPAHPHEGAVGAPYDEPSAYEIASGRSLVTGLPFNLVVVFDGSREHSGAGRAVVHSSFHHFADYNWNPELGCPDGVTELPGNGYAVNPDALGDIKTYIENLALWLDPARA